MVVVGSGAGGGVIAAEAARAGRSVIVVEAGAFIPEPEMPTDELAAYDRMYLDHGLTATWDGAISILAGAVVGGGTTVNWTTCIPPRRSVRAEWAHDHGIDGADGAEFDDDLAVIEREIGVQGPPNVPAKDAAILRGAAALGWEAGETRRDGVGCGDCGSCPFGCRRGAKQGGLRVHLADAWRNGARIVPDARDGARSREAGAGVGDGGAPVSADGRRRRGPLRRQVVLAAGALRTPGILERSGFAHAASAGTCHCTPYRSSRASSREPVDMWSGRSQAARSLEFVPTRRGVRRFVINPRPVTSGLIALAFPWESTDDFSRSS